MKCLELSKSFLTIDLGISQATVFDNEQKEALDGKVLEKVSQILKVPIETIKTWVIKLLIILLIHLITIPKQME